jgi:hypothetical protein
MFYTFNQNNSGGYFVIDEKHGVCEHVIIEAETLGQADARLQAIGANVDGFSDWCNCCGERWSSSWMDDDDGTEQPMIYDTLVHEEVKDGFRTRCFVHHADGRIECVIFPEKTQ